MFPKYIFPTLCFSLVLAGCQIVKPIKVDPASTLPPSTPTLIPTTTPTPKPPTLSELNAKFGPCAVVPTLMYHHIQSTEAAAVKGQKNITVDTSTFQTQMSYLQDHGYQPISTSQLLDFFKSGSSLPSKPILLTFDDAYHDFYTDAYPILKSSNFPAIVFVPTGLIENPDYLTWPEIQEMAQSGLIYFANHTWSHHSMASSMATDMREMQTADEQLISRNLNSQKIFAYPYGSENVNALANLNTLGYHLAFTTKPGRILCAREPFQLPRIRMASRPLSAFGL
jgi:peptidoglycan/xylan/chitin deacetylase (PgdA/CDA1 family)